MKAIVTIPGLRLKSELNDRSHWAVRDRRRREQQASVAIALSQLGTEIKNEMRAAKQIRVRFVRIGGKQFDDDNLVSACKFVRDQVAKWLRKSDAPGSGVEWVMPPGQESGAFAVRIELETIN